MSTIILDLDNCISDDGWRINRIRWDCKNIDEKYSYYHLSGFFDQCNNKHLFQDDSKSYVILTSRPLVHLKSTEDWLKMEGITYDALIMRNPNDHRHSVDLKCEMLLWLPEHYGVPLKDIEMAYDDRPEIVAMYHQMGLPAKVVSIHNIPYHQQNES